VTAAGLRRLSRKLRLRNPASLSHLVLPLVQADSQADGVGSQPRTDRTKD